MNIQNLLNTKKEMISINLTSRELSYYITAILPAHNESKGISSAIHSIKPHVNRIIVACDNCSDNTAQIAKKAGATTVFNTKNNNNRKAGALNQALEHYVNWNIKNQYIMIMDADTIVVHPKLWFSKAKSLIAPQRKPLSKTARRMNKLQKITFHIIHPKKYHKLFNNRAYDCVGSIFKAPVHLKHNNNIEEGQRLEWEAYMSKIRRSRKVFVLTGTCSLISAKKLLQVYKMYHKKQFYNDNDITEDFRMTIDLKECGARMISPVDCQCITATKSNIKDLLDQRRRWYLGALQIIGNHKIDKVMFPYLCQQLMLFVSVFAFLLFLLLSIYLYGTGNVKLKWIWLIVFLGFDLNQVMRIWSDSSLIDKLYAMSMLGCLYYSFLLQMAYLWALKSWINKEHVYWNSDKK